MKTPEEFLEYVASFNPKYVTDQVAKDLIKQAKKIKND